MNHELELATVRDTGLPEVPRMVLFDDDPFFVRMMLQCARESMIPLTGVWRMDDVGAVVQRNFDLAIVDFDLGDFSGLELVEFLDEIFGSMPMVMISHSQRSPDRKHPWPDSIQNFVLKEQGPFTILETAIKTYAAAQ